MNRTSTRIIYCEFGSTDLNFTSNVLFSFSSKDVKHGRTDLCSSKVGRVGGAQAVTLGRACLTTGTEEEILGRVQHEILHAVGFLHEMNRPDRDSHIKLDKNLYKTQGLTFRDFEQWNLGDGRQNESELSRLTTNYDINSILHYRPKYGIKALNPYYNEVGFGDSYKMTATDKVALNIFLSCPTIKKKVCEEYQEEEINRNYIELMQLTINTNARSER